VSLLLTYLDLLLVLAHACSCLGFDLTLGVIPSDYVASSYSPYFSKLYCI
jgi:hypothetical protein